MAVPAHCRTLSQTIHRTQCTCAQQSNVKYNRRGTVRITCVFSFCKKCVWNTSHSKKYSRRRDQNIYVVLPIRYSLLVTRFNEPWIISTDFKKKSSIIKFHENPSRGIRVIPKKLTGTLGLDKGGFSNFWHCANKNKQTHTQTHTRGQYTQVPLSYSFNRSSF